MKRLILALLLTCFALPALAADVKIAWDDNNLASAGVSSYIVYRGTTAAGLVAIGTVTAPTKTFTDVGLTPGVYYFGVTAKNTWGESGKSNIINTPTTTIPPANLIFVVTLTQNPDGTYSVDIKAIPVTDGFFRFNEG